MSVTARQYEPRGFPRQVLDSGQSLLVIFAGLLVIASVAQTAVIGVRDVPAAVAFGALIAFGVLLRIGDSPARHGPQQVIAVAAVAMIIGALPHLAVGRPARLPAMAARLLAVACAAALFRPLANASLIGGQWWSELPVMLLLVIAAWLVEVVIAALIRTDE